MSPRYSHLFTALFLVVAGGRVVAGGSWLQRDWSRMHFMPTCEDTRAKQIKHPPGGGWVEKELCVDMTAKDALPSGDWLEWYPLTGSPTAVDLSARVPSVTHGAIDASTYIDFGWFGYYQSFQGFNVHLHQATVTGGRPGAGVGTVIMDARKSIYQEGGCHCCGSDTDWKSRSAHVARKKTIRLEGTVIYLAQTWGHSFWHSYTEMLPRLMQAIHWVDDSNKTQARLLIQTNFPEALSTLYSLGVSAQQVVEFKPDEHAYQIEHLVLPRAVPCGSPISWLQQQLVQRFERAGWYEGCEVKPQAGRKPRLLILERSLAGERHVRNHVQMVKALRTKFDVHEMKDVGSTPMTVKEQACILRRHHAVLIPHGSTSTNVMHMLEGSQFFELLPMKPQPNWCAYNLAFAMNIRHYAFAIPEAEYHGPRSNYNVDVDALVSFISTHIESSPRGRRGTARRRQDGNDQWRQAGSGYDRRGD
jgi:hypothetical protein